MASHDASPRGGRTLRGRLMAFLTHDHRYVLLGTSAVAFAGMLLSSQPRPALSFLAQAYTVEVVLYYLLVAWLVLAAAALAYKLTHWRSYDECAPFTRPAARRVLRYASYAVWAVALVLAVDRLVMGLASAWMVATTAASRPVDDALASALYMFYQGRQTFITGITTTIALAVFGTILAFFLALLLAFCRIQTIDRSDNDFVRFWKVLGVDFAKVYSAVVRGTPMMVQAGIIFFGGIALLRGTGLTTSEVNVVWSPFIAGFVTITLNSTAYMMEVLRGGIESVDSGQMEAARSLGLSQWQAMRKVVFPQGIKYAIPGLSNELVVNIKDSSVLSVIGTFDLMFATNSIAGIYYQQLQANMIAAVAYLVLTMIATKLLTKFSERLSAQTGPVVVMSDSTVQAEMLRASHDRGDV